MKKTGLAVLMALLCLPIGAKAVREGVVENAPMVEVRETASYLPSVRQEKTETDWMLEEAYTEIDTTEMMYADIGRWLTSNCRLTMGERKRMEKLMAAYAAGERTGDGASVLEAKKRVRVGVYALDPKDYDGERVLLLLPGNCLTDEEMLAILDAYHQLGEVFDPDALNERNCVRGHTYTRDLSKEEDERNENLRSQIERGILRREDVPETLKAVELDNASFLGSYNGKFIFAPYRRSWPICCFSRMCKTSARALTSTCWNATPGWPYMRRAIRSAQRFTGCTATRIEFSPAENGRKSGLFR